MVETEPGTLLEALEAALRQAAEYNSADQAAPAVVLWPDKERQWSPLAPLLRDHVPLLTAGPYCPANRTGPAYWLRCVIAGTIAVEMPKGVPIVYLPGIAKQDIRAVEDCPRELQPVAELQYRGVLWTHPNGRDWTVAGFIQNQESGMGIGIAADTATKEALQRALIKVANEPIERLKASAPLRAEFFNALLHPDDIRDILLWLNDAAVYRKRLSDAEWDAFRAVCKSQFGFDPEKDGPVAAAQLLGRQQGKWDAVWRRWVDAPRNYPYIPDLLRKAAPPQQLSMFEHRAAWPQANELAEDRLREALMRLKDLHAVDACERLLQLEAEHGQRRASVWAKLDRTPLAQAVEHLAGLAAGARQPLAGSSVAEIASRYAEQGWKVDRAAIGALACTALARDVEAVKTAIAATYRDWLETGAVALQNAVRDHGSALAGGAPEAAASGTCLLFTDGLRLDLGHWLASMLKERRVQCEVATSFAALPSVTATAKPAVSPVAFRFGKGDELAPKVNATGATVTVDVLRTMLSGAGFQVLKGEELGDPTGKAWAEYGDLDRCGHTFGCGLARQAEGELKGIAERVLALIDRGWQQVIVVTDHGWLLLPGGLPKAELPEHLTVVRKGRCARLKDMAHTDQQTVPWRWDEQVQIALAPGIHCYEAGKEYEHGGLSAQECVVPVITVAPAVPRANLTIESVAWTGLRCRVSLAGTGSGASVDIRTAPADANSSIAESVKPATGGQISLVVPDDDREGTAAVVVAVSSSGDILAQRPTIVGHK